MIHRILLITALLFAGSVQPLLAADAPAPSAFSNPFVVIMVIIMIILLIAIGVLANILIGTADVQLIKWKKKEEERKTSSANAKAITSVVLLLLSLGAFAQDEAGAAPAPIIHGISNTAFYLMVTVIFIELLIILGFLFNIKLLLRTQQEKETEAAGEAVAYAPSKPSKAKSWWSRFNRFKPIEQEADIDLGHDYDGIRELDNRLPPWWLWGFYLTILFAVVYLWRFHVSHTAPSSKEEYENAVAKAEKEISEYIKQKGETVDENTVTMLTDVEDLSAGQKIFNVSCVSCHKEDGGGLVGPNLTDDYWMHGGDIKSVFKTIKYGINAMPQWQNAYSNKQIAQLASYVKSLHGTHPADAKEPQGELYEEAPPAPAASPDSTVTAGTEGALSRMDQ